jgi:hypothetical protein
MSPNYINVIKLVPGKLLFAIRKNLKQIDDVLSHCTLDPLQPPFCKACPLCHRFVDRVVKAILYRPRNRKSQVQAWLSIGNYPTENSGPSAESDSFPTGTDRFPGIEIESVPSALIPEKCRSKIGQDQFARCQKYALNCNVSIMHPQIFMYFLIPIPFPTN